MYLNAKKMAFLGLLLAFSVILVILSSIIEFNTLLLLGLAAFFVGIAIRECGHRLGAGFYIAAVILALLLSPNKWYCLTYAAFGLYIVVIEFIWTMLEKKQPTKGMTILFHGIKFILFNIMYVPMILFSPSLFYQGSIDSKILVFLWIVGQIVIAIYDMVYVRFQLYYGEKIRKHIKLLE